MSIEAALFTLLTTTPSIAAKVADRVYPKQLPQDPTTPAIVYHRISGPREHSHDGSSGLAHPRFQLDMYAGSYLEAKALADAVRVAIDGYKGTVEGVEIQAIFLENDDDGHDDELKVYWFQADYIIWHAE